MESLRKNPSNAARVCSIFGEIYDFCQKTENETDHFGAVFTHLSFSRIFSSLAGVISPASF